MKDDVISRAAAIDTIKDADVFVCYSENESVEIENVIDLAIRATKGSVIASIEQMPSADAVPVVRCKDCAHNNLPPTAGNALCSIYYGMTEVYGFCHRGERREEDGTLN